MHGILRRHSTSGLLLTLLVAPSPAQDQDDFTSGLALVERSVNNGQWKTAQRRLDDLLEEHQDADYVRRARVKIIELAKENAFRLSFSGPEPEDVVSGELLSYNESTGRIRIRYTPRQLDDFDSTGGIFVHPLIFDGAHTITLQGPAGAGRNLSFVVCVTNDTAYRVVCRNYVRIEQSDGSEWRELAHRVITLGTSRRPFTAQVKVTGTSIALYFDGKRILQARKGRNDFGQSGFAASKFSEVIFEGNANTAWIQGKLDAVTNTARDQYAKSFDPEKVLPEWLLAEPAAADSSSSNLARFPDSIPEVDRGVLWPVAELIRAENFLEAQTVLDDHGGANTPVSNAYLSASINLDLGLLERALDLIGPVCVDHPEFLEARVLRGRILESARKREAALAEYRAVLDLDPSNLDAAALGAMLLMRMGRFDDAGGILADTRDAGGNSEILDGIERNVLKARYGPSWPQRFESKSRKFSVQSDIDARTSADARNVLETAHVAFQAEFERLSASEREPLRVYLFSGEAGYQAYCRELWGAPQPHTAGLYSPDLKQLLIWNLPDRDMMLRTVRHEGWHQYLDSIMVDPPMWLNEGSAEYFEIAERRGGQYTGDQIHSNHVSTLQGKGTGLPGLAELVSWDRKTYYADPELSYAYGWAAVHFLRHSSRENRRVFDDVFSGLQEGLSSAEAFGRALGNRTFADLDREFQEHLRSLR